jgi:hypothetical protein
MKHTIKVCIAKRLSDSFQIQNDLKKGNDLWSLLQLCFIIWHPEGPGKPGGTEIE